MLDMKRKIIQTIIVVFFVAFAGYKAYSSLSPKAKLSDLVLENIEALAYNENNPGPPVNPPPDGRQIYHPVYRFAPWRKSDGFPYQREPAPPRHRVSAPVPGFPWERIQRTPQGI